MESQTREWGRSAVVAAAVFGFTGVGLGAFGAHGLKDLLEANGRLDVWETAVFYQMIHAVALLAVGLGFQALDGGSRLRSIIWRSWAVGILIFSGSLYTLALTNTGWLGAITPIGGVAFLVGWAALFWVTGQGRGKQL